MEKFGKLSVHPRQIQTGLIFLALSFVLVAGVALVINGVESIRSPKVPEIILLEDYQRPLDRDLGGILETTETTIVSQFIDENIFKPFFDDVVTLSMTVEGVEIGPEQFPELNRMVEECVKILHLKQRPRVFIADRPGLNAYTTNFEDPIIVLHSALLRRYDNPAELRFIIGHEMGHIASNHVKLLTVLRAVFAGFSGSLLPDQAGTVLLLPLCKWSREAEMTADNAGLVCAQDLAASERALLRLKLGLDDYTLGLINVEAYLKQKSRQDFSKWAEIVQYWHELKQDHPFVPERIEQLREYSQSRNYLHLWE